jgi:hypothetical protein
MTIILPDAERKVPNARPKILLAVSPTARLAGGYAAPEGGQGHGVGLSDSRCACGSDGSLETLIRLAPCLRTLPSKP